MQFIRLLFFISICTGFHAQKINVSARAFIQNKGQIHNQHYLPNQNVLFMYSGKGFNIQLRKTGYSYELFSVNNFPEQKPGKKTYLKPEYLRKITLQTSRIDIDFYGMNSNVEVINSEPVPGLLNYICPGNETYDIRSYRKITYKNVYDNIDIEFTLTGNELNPLKYNIILHPGADMNKLMFLCEGANSVKKQNNEIKIKTGLGEISEKIPFSYYSDTPAQNHPVDFMLKNNTFSFSSDHDKSRTLIIDPSSNIIWGTYFGGSALEFCNATGTDSQNNVYFTGHTLSTSNIATSGAYQTSSGGDLDIFLSKFDSNGNIIWSTYFGGSSYEQAFGLFVEPNGTIYVAGDSGTNSGMATAGAHQTTYGGGLDDGLLAKFDTNGQRIWSTYYGGTEHDFAYCLTRDSNGNVIIAGHTESANSANAIATPGSYNSSFTFFVDAFVAKFDGNGVRQWGSYYGESGNEEALGVAADGAGNVIITGFTNSLANISTPTGHQPFFGGSLDAFVAKFDPTGANLLWGTYYGGGAEEQGFTVEASSAGDIFVSGYTGSNSTISTPGSHQIAHGGSEDVFLVRFNSAGQRQWGTYYGGTATEYVYDLLIDPQMNLMICGQTTSTNSISTGDGFQPIIGQVNTYDGYFAKFSGNGSLLMLGSYYGNSGNDAARGIALDNTGKLYVCGESTSTIGITTSGAYMPNAAGNGDAFLSKFCIAPFPEITPATGTICLNDSYTLTATPGYASYYWSNATFPNPLILSGGWMPGNYYYYVTVSDGFGCTGTSDSVVVTVNNCLTGIHETKKETGFQIFPVPAHDHIVVEDNLSDFSHKIPYKIFSSTGQLVKSSELDKPRQPIELENLPPGIYFLELKTSEGKVVKKFVKN